MNHQTWTTKKFRIVLLVAFFAGVMFAAPLGDTQVDSATDSNVQSLSKEAINEVKAEGQERFDQLDAIDQQIFAASAEVVDAQTKSLEVAGAILSNLETISISDIEAGTEIVEEQNRRVRAATDKVEDLKAKRDALLDQ